MHLNIMEKSELNNNHINSSFQREKWFGHEFLYEFHGFWFTKTYLETTQKVLENFKPHPKDVILASFPKTGTTWLKALLHSITHRYDTKDENSLTFNHPQELIPSLETNLYVQEIPQNNTNSQEFISTKNPQKSRILATHIPYQIFGGVLNSSDCKVVYVTRNPKDTLISLWHFLRKSKNFEQDPWELGAAVDQFCKGIVPFGSYYDHVLAYREESLKRPQKVHFVTYEELKENPKNCVEKMGEFLGCPFEGENREEEIEEIVKICSFEKLSNQEVNKSSELPKVFPLPYNSFYRKGQVGDHMNYLEDEMIEKIDNITREKFHGIGFMYGI
ncbi:hypothetical protein BUALT_Bualt16G0024800 [Buddleja alternifolia]|uniref:Sulfotransferase n=1 Tax=Buddleja alternifolia TaxID=168488 RepID=A0AAV6WDV3_9LAMI|nr:hypothetical protein BUALT_Bualt16G0024800 [Buddleja alternifolia]